MLALNLGAGRFFLGESFFTPRKLLISFLRVRFSLLDHPELPIQILFPLNEPFVRHRQLSKPDLLLFFQIRFGLEDQILRLKFGFLDERFGLALSVLGNLFRLIFRFRSFRCGELTTNHLKQTGTDQSPDESTEYVGNE